MRAVVALGATVAWLQTTTALTNWYTPPGGPPTGSTPGDKVRGVNLGGWFILENWMMPSLFAVPPIDQQVVNDEWTYCSILGKAECQKRLEQHWDTYVTEEDFKRFAAYGLNTVRIPMGYWAWTDIEGYEPYVQGQLPYLEKALNWSTVYGLDVMMDLHGLPGGQNSQDNQGYKGFLEFAYNTTNTDRAVAAIVNMTQHTTQDRFGGIVKSIELANEPYLDVSNPSGSGGIPFSVLTDYYVKAYTAIRQNENIVAGSKEVMVVLHDAFQPLLNWRYFFSQPELGLNWINYALDTHIYDAFGSAQYKSNQEHLDTICSYAANLAAAQQEFPIIVGEFSLGTTTYCVDYQTCFGQVLQNAISGLTSSEAALFLRQFWEVQADVYEQAAGWIFWSHANELGAPWSWSQSAAQGWIPQDPEDKLYPFYPGASSGCLDIWNPYNGTSPSFPDTAVNVSSINTAGVRAKIPNSSESSATSSTQASATVFTSVSSTHVSVSSISTAAAAPSASALKDATSSSSRMRSLYWPALIASPVVLCLLVA